MQLWGDFAAYIDGMRRPGVHGDEISVNAAINLFKRMVRVYRVGLAPQLMCPAEYTQAATQKVVEIVHVGGNHYDFVEDWHCRWWGSMMRYGVQTSFEIVLHMFVRASPLTSFLSVGMFVLCVMHSGDSL